MSSLTNRTLTILLILGRWKEWGEVLTPSLSPREDRAETNSCWEGGGEVAPEEPGEEGEARLDPLREPNTESTTSLYSGPKVKRSLSGGANERKGRPV